MTLIEPVFVSTVLLAARGSDPLDPGAGDDPGAGTRTLFVDGRISAEPRFANAKLPAIAARPPTSRRSMPTSSTGAYMMGVGVLRADNDEVRENRLEVRRTNHVAPAGAIAGSDFAVTIRNELTVLVAPNPAL